VPDVRLEDAPCPLCRSRRDEVLLTGHDRLLGLPGSFTVVKCRGCGLVRTNPRPTRDSIHIYYPDHYGPYIGTKASRPIAQPGQTRLPAPLKSLGRTVLDAKTMALPALLPGFMLEIGCASGAFLQRMALRGWQVEGIEFSRAAAREAMALGYEVYSGSLEDAPRPAQAPDLVVGWMVLEHLHDPLGCLRKLSQWASPGAWLVVSVPNIASWDFRLFKDAWYALQLPNHLYHFSPSTLDRLLQQSGWQRCRIFHQRVLSNYLGSMGHVLSENGSKNRVTQWLNDYPQNAGRLHYWLHPIALALSALGQTGRMTVWARKRNG